MTRIILVRHGQTEWNRVERFRGQADLALDEIGVRQSEATAERIAEWPVSAVYTSPLRRAVSTAEIIGRRLGVRPGLLPGLIDMSFGEWEGLTPAEASAQDHGLWERWVKTPHLVVFPGGESLALARERSGGAAEEVIGKHPDEAIVLVAHRVICQILCLHFLGLDISNFWRVVLDVAGISVFERTDLGIFVLGLNDTCHLRRGLMSPASRIYRGTKGKEG